MEKKKYDVCLEVLKRFSEAGILNDIILIGSWCLYFYKEYFAGVYFPPSIRTRDIDFLVPIPPKFKRKVDVPELLKDMGFIPECLGAEGYVRLGHPELIVEFLVPERGKGINKPYKLSQISLNAQPLRYLDFLIDNTIELSICGMRIKMPHPVAFALHKLIILGRRIKREKAQKDLEQAINLLHFVIENDKPEEISAIYKYMPRKWQATVVKILKDCQEEKILKALNGTEARKPLRGA